MAAMAGARGISYSIPPSQKHYPRALTFHQLVRSNNHFSDDGPQKKPKAANGTTETTSDSNSQFLLVHVEVPNEIRRHVLSFLDLPSLFSLAHSCSAIHGIAMDYIFSQRHLWFLYNHRTFNKYRPKLAVGDFTEYGSLTVECSQAAKLVTQLQISGAAISTSERSEWGYLGDQALWNELFTFFPSVRRIMIRIKNPREPRQLHTSNQFPEEQSLVRGHGFWSCLTKVAEEQGISIWFETGEPTTPVFYLMRTDKPLMIRGHLREKAVANPHHPMSVYVQDYITLPPITGPLGKFIRWRSFQDGVEPTEHYGFLLIGANIIDDLRYILKHGDQLVPKFKPTRASIQHSFELPYQSPLFYALGDLVQYIIKLGSGSFSHGRNIFSDIFAQQLVDERFVLIPKQAAEFHTEPSIFGEPSYFGEPALQREYTTHPELSNFETALVLDESDVRGENAVTDSCILTTFSKPSVLAKPGFLKNVRASPLNQIMEKCMLVLETLVEFTATEMTHLTASELTAKEEDLMKDLAKLHVYRTNADVNKLKSVFWHLAE